MQKVKLSRREREKLRQRRQMLAAALELFSEKGFHNVTMHEIAKRAEFAIGTLYKFFKNKEDLYKSLIVEQADRFHEALTKAIGETDDEIEKLRNYVK
nr:TetR/AcrR family transcriptional regulator [Deltaproteobacteria bacterium]